MTTKTKNDRIKIEFYSQHCLLLAQDAELLAQAAECEPGPVLPATWRESAREYERLARRYEALAKEEPSSLARDVFEICTTHQ